MGFKMIPLTELERFQIEPFQQELLELKGMNTSYLRLMWTLIQSNDEDVIREAIIESEALRLNCEHMKKLVLQRFPDFCDRVEVYESQINNWLEEHYNDKNTPNIKTGRADAEDTKCVPEK